MNFFSCLTFGLLAISNVVAIGPTPIPLGTAAKFGILAQTGVSSISHSAIIGAIGVSPAASTYITGFSLVLSPSGTYSTSNQVKGQILAASYASPTPSTLTVAVGDMQTAYTNGMGRLKPNYINFQSGNIGGSTLTGGLYMWPGVVNADTSFSISGSDTDTWIFQIEGTFNLATGVSVTLEGGALPQNIFWVVAGAVTFGTGSEFQGIVLGKTGVTLDTGATMTGQIYAQTFVTLQMATVTRTT